MTVMVDGLCNSNARTDTQLGYHYLAEGQLKPRHVQASSQIRDDLKELH